MTAGALPLRKINPWQNQPKHSLNTEGVSLLGAPASLSLEAVKNIWRKYQKLDTTKVMDVDSPSFENTNALELSLGMENIASTTPTDGDLSAVGNQGDAPPPNGHAVMREPQFSPPSTFELSQHDPSVHSMDKVRGVLMDTVKKTIQLRNPNQDIDLERLDVRISQKISDSDVQNFAHMSKEVIDQLQRFGKIKEAKRKYASIGGMEDEEGRLKPRTDRSASPGSLEEPYTPDPGSDPSQSHSRIKDVNSPLTASAQSDRPTRRTTPRAPRSTLGYQWQDISSLPSSNTVSRHLSNPKRDILDREPSTPLHEDVSMSMSITPQQGHDSPHSSRFSHILSKQGHSRNLQPPDVSPSGHDLNGSENQSICHSRSREPASLGVGFLPDLCASKILLAKVGLPSADLLEASFDVDEKLVAAARRWAQRSMHFDPNELHMRLRLVSIPTTAAEIAHRELPPNSPPSLLADAVSQIGVAWPAPGTFYVSLNKDRPEARSWGDHFFTASSPPLDISDVVIPGKNHLQLVQLADQTHLLFLVIAVRPSEEEKLAEQSQPTAWDRISREFNATTPVKLQLGLICNVP